MPLNVKAAIQIQKTLERIKIVDSDAFENLCVSLDGLEEDKQLVLAHIFSRMYYCELSQYPIKMKSIVSTACQEIRKRNYKKAYISPVRSKDARQAKSGETVAYSVRAAGHFEKCMPNFKIEHLNLPIPQRANNSVLVLLDDYVGSGGSVEKVLKKDGLDWDLEDVIVCCIACHSHGFEYLDTLGIEVFAADLRDRSISDYPKNDLDKEFAIEVMDWFAREFEVDADKVLGWGACESIDLLMRIPNNCLPFMWHNSKPSAEQEKTWIAPFARFY